MGVVPRWCGCGCVGQRGTYLSTVPSSTNKRGCRLGRLGREREGKNERAQEEGVGGKERMEDKGQGTGGLEPQTSQTSDLDPSRLSSDLQGSLSNNKPARSCPQGSGSLCRPCPPFILPSGLVRPEKALQEPDAPSHVTSSFRRFWISFPGFQAYSVTASQSVQSSQPVFFLPS